MKSKRLLSFLCVALSLTTAYVVQDGDTLWDISDEHLQDPFHWPEVWESNPQVANPHLIYPGDTLSLPGKMSQQDNLDDFAAPGSISESNGKHVSSGEYASGNRKNSFLSKIGNLKGKGNEFDNLEKDLGSTIQPIKPQVYGILNSYMHIVAPELLPAHSDIKLIKEQYSVKFDKRANGNLLQANQHAVIMAGTKQGFNVGQLVQLFPHKKLRVEGVTKNNMTPLYPFYLSGIGEIIESSENQSRILLHKVFQPIMPFYTRAALYQKLKSPLISKYTAVKSTKTEEMATVIHSFKKGGLNHTHSWLGLDKGNKAGFELGDGVAIWEKERQNAKELSPRLIGSGIIIKSTENTSTVYIRSLIDNANLPEDLDKVSITHKAIAPK